VDYRGEWRKSAHEKIRENCSQEKDMGIQIQINVMVCEAFPKNILSMKKLLEKSHTIMLKLETWFILVKQPGAHAMIQQLTLHVTRE
jgi:hypothetical protein